MEVWELFLVILAKVTNAENFGHFAHTVTYIGHEYQRWKFSYGNWARLTPWISS